MRQSLKTRPGGMDCIWLVVMIWLLVLFLGERGRGGGSILAEGVDLSTAGCYRRSGAGGTDFVNEITNLPAATPADCAHSCQQQDQYPNDKYIALTNGGARCFCADLFGGNGPSSGCDQQCTDDVTQLCGGTDIDDVSVYKILSLDQFPMSETTVLGCYEDSDVTPDMDVVAYSGSATMKPELCAQYCYDHAYMYMGLQGGDSCSCTSTATRRYARLDNDQCAVPCTGNSTATCGGIGANMVYHLYTEVRTTQYLGCFLDTAATRALPVEVRYPDNLTPRACAERCRQEGKRYAGLEAHDWCYCGDGPHDINGRIDDCDMRCSSGAGVCGSNWRLSVLDLKPVSTSGSHFALIHDDMTCSTHADSIAVTSLTQCCGHCIVDLDCAAVNVNLGAGADIECLILHTADVTSCNQSSDGWQVYEIHDTHEAVHATHPDGSIA